MDVHHLLHSGHASSSGDELEDEEWERFRAERRAALARKRPPGFAPWPEED